MNILLTTDCSLDCSYCFARSLRSEGAEMSLQELDILVSSLTPGKDPVRLMGGEPTLHSCYPEIIRMLKVNNYQVVVFTNGLQKVLRETTPHIPDRILVNINDWESYSKSQCAAIRENLSFLGERVSLGYTILEPHFDLSVHRDLIIEYHLQPVIRLGLAQPIIGGDNAYLSDSALPEAHRQVVGWAEALVNDGIRLSLDCGFVRSNFNDEDIEKMVRAYTMLRFDCTPSIDVRPGLRSLRCFAFSEIKSPGWADFKDVEQRQAWFNRQDDFLWQTIQDDDHKESGLGHEGCLARQWNRAKKKRALKEMNLLNIVRLESI